MQVSIETTSGLERRMTVGVPAEEIDKEIAQRLQKASQTVRIDGFRKGKIPAKVIKQRFGAGVRQEVVGEVLSRTFYEAVTKEELRPAGQPAIEPVKDEEGADLEYIATFEVYPEISLQDFSQISLSRPVATVSDEDLTDMVENLRKQRANWDVVERAAADGDQVNIDYKGTQNGEEFPGGTADASDLVLGSGRMIPGFEDGVVGLSADEEKTISLTFPEDYHAEDLRGAAVEFAVKVNAVKEQTLPELNDEFYEQFGVKEGGEEKFLVEIRSNMERELETAIKNKVKSRLMNKLQALHTIETPKALLTNEIQALRQQMVGQFGGAQQMDMSIFPDELFADEAGKRVSLGLLMAEIVKVAEITVDNDKVKAFIEERAASYDDPEQVIQYHYNNEELLNSVQSAVMEEQVVEHILGLADVAEEATDYKGALTPDPAEEKKSDDDSED
ncbi:MAG: trigger factor [Gammaproteobacteria bacterium]|nr:trigger factor [Gammaproteobacteria bacterium]MBQ0838968.1 trigger factor [Gammaproteobacteria bacterium]